MVVYHGPWTMFRLECRESEGRSLAGLQRVRGAAPQVAGGSGDSVGFVAPPGAAAGTGGTASTASEHSRHSRHCIRGRHSGQSRNNRHRRYSTAGTAGTADTAGIGGAAGTPGAAPNKIKGATQSH